MGRIAVFILALFVLTSFTGPGDPPEVGISFNSFWKSKSVAIAGYTKINARYEWVAGAFDSGLHVPQYNGVPSGLRSGVWTADGAVAVDTSNHRLYFYSGGSWRYSTSGTGGGTPTLQQVLTAGSTVDQDNTISSEGFDFRIQTDFTTANFFNQFFSVAVDNNASEVSALKIYPDSIRVEPDSGKLYIDSLNYTLSTTGKKIMLRDTASGLVQNIDPALIGGSTAISALTAATGTNTIDNGAYSQRWEWNTLSGTGGTGLDLYSNSTAADFNAQTLFKATLQGANSNSTQTTQAAVIQNTHSGTSSTNIGLYVASTSGTNNYALIVPSSGGSVGIGTSAPAKKFHTVGTVRHETLGTASGDTTANKPVGINSSGDIIPITYWPGGGGSGNVTKVGTPVNNQVGVWTGDGTLEGDANLTFASSTLNIGVASSSKGILTLSGNTSGTVTIQPAAAAGTWTMTLPTNDGNSGEFLQTDGSGVLSWAAASGVTASSTTTFTNKRWTARVGSTTSSGTPTINTDDYDIYKLTAQAADITSFTTNLSGTPNDGDILEIQITGTAARAITWGASFVSSTVTLPATTVTTATLTVILQYYTTSSYGNNKWVCVNYY